MAKKRRIAQITFLSFFFLLQFMLPVYVIVASNLQDVKLICEESFLTEEISVGIEEMANTTIEEENDNLDFVSENEIASSDLTSLNESEDETISEEIDSSNEFEEESTSEESNSLSELEDEFTSSTDEPEVSTEEETSSEDIQAEGGFEWNGEVLNAYNGVVYGPSGKETYYNLDMTWIVERMHRRGYNYEYHVREDGVKMFGPYVMCAANFEIRPLGTILETSLGTAIVCDTGGFAKKNPTQLDIAVDW